MGFFFPAIPLPGCCVGAAAFVAPLEGCDDCAIISDESEIARAAIAMRMSKFRIVYSLRLHEAQKYREKLRRSFKIPTDGVSPAPRGYVRIPGMVIRRSRRW